MSLLLSTKSTSAFVHSSGIPGALCYLVDGGSEAKGVTGVILS